MTTLQPTRLNILLADDDEDDRFFFEKGLLELPVKHYFKTFPNGEWLLTYLSKNSKSLPDVLFLDLNMPRKNGTECLKEIKGNKKLKGIPVVIYSTSLQTDMADMLYQTGAHYYLHKGDFNELSKSIDMILGLLSENPAQPARTEFVIRVAEAESNETVEYVEANS